MINLVFSKFKKWNEKFGWLLSIIAIPSLLNDLSWWSSLFQFIVSLVPRWVADSLIFARDAIRPVIEAYERFAVLIFSFLPFTIPNWLSIVLPPLMSLAVASLLTYSVYNRTKRTSNHLSMISDPRFLSGSVVWEMIKLEDVKLPKDYLFSEIRDDRGDFLDIVKPQFDRLLKSSKIRMVSLIVLISIYVIIVLIEIVYRVTLLTR